GAVPEAGRGAAPEEEGTTEGVADLRHADLDVRGELGGGVEGEEEVILQVPADALAILLGDVNGERDRGALGWARAFEGELDQVVARRRLGGLGQAEGAMGAGWVGHPSKATGRAAGRPWGAEAAEVSEQGERTTTCPNAGAGRPPVQEGQGTDPPGSETHSARARCSTST